MTEATEGTAPSEEKQDETDGGDRPVTNIKAFINQFNNQPMKFPKPIQGSNKPMTGPAKPIPPKKPGVQQSLPGTNGFKPIVPTKEILSKKVTLKPVDAKSSGNDEGDNTINVKKTKALPIVAKKPPADKENKPPVLPKKPSGSNVSEGPVTGGVNLEEIKSRLKKPKTLSPVPPKKDTRTEPEYDGDQVYTSESGVQYRSLKMPSNSGPSPAKPALPPHPDLYDFQVDDAVDDDLYEDYSDVVVASSNKDRVVSMIPILSEEEEMNAIGQEEYTDTEVPSANQRPLSMQDEEYYEALDS